MIERARRILPGMIASLLLAAPLSAHAATIDPAAGKPLEHRRPAARTHKHAARPGHLQARRRTTPQPAPQIAAFFDDTGAWHQQGVASWYGGPRWQGHPTASGARYEQNGLTAAHATLPLGSHVRVTLAGSDRSVIVTINDRPGTRTRIIDLSRGAASALGILDRGIAPVELSLLP
jgi:rare lipoprotein A (peptidoglycan hydrolase)